MSPRGKHQRRTPFYFRDGPVTVRSTRTGYLVSVDGSNEARHFPKVRQAMDYADAVTAEISANPLPLEVAS